MSNKYAAWLPVEDFGAKLKRIRTQKGWSMQDVVDRAPGLNKSVISRIENGHDFQFSSLLLIVQTYEISLDELFTNVNMGTLKSYSRE